MADLTALSREIAATSDAWMVPGVWAIESDNECVCLLCWHDGHKWNACTTTGAWMRFRDTNRLRPDLSDPVTVNALLGSDGEVARLEGKQSFLAVIDNGAAWSIDRTEAICRAWIAANKGEP